MVPTPERPQPSHLEASGWHMEKLLQDLAVAKKTLRPKSQGLSPLEQECLCLLLIGVGPDEIPKRLGRKSSIRSELSKGLYDYIGLHIGKRPTDWRDIQRWFEPDYRTNPQTKTRDATFLLEEKAVVTDVSKHFDLDEAPELDLFYGRIAELAQLHQMIVGDRCKLVSLLGMGGIGKTSLATMLVESIKEQFDHVIWRSLRNNPPIEDILADLISFFADQPISLPEELDRQLSLLMDYLRKQRCLIILDNAESISGIPDAENGAYRLNSVGYGLLIQRIAEERHNSCLLLTSRERFADLTLLEGKKVRSFPLTGLSIEEGQEIFTQTGSLTASKQDWGLIIDHYAGNPLALKIVAAGIRDFLDGNVAKFLDLLQRGNFVFGNINDLLQRQFNRISELEQEVMYWLATAREPVSFEELQNDLVSARSKQHLFNTLSILQGRSLIEKVTGSKFTQQPVIMEYATSRFIEEICREITVQMPQLLNQFPLIKAQAKDYIRIAQVRLILKPISDRLVIIFANEDEHELVKNLMDLKHQFYNKPGYFGGNLLNLLRQLSVDLSGYDFSNLVIWQAYLQNQILQGVNFAKSDLSHSVFTETFGSVFCVAFSPDNRLLVSGDASGDLRIWEVLTGRQLFICKGHTNRIWSVAFNPVNFSIASSSSDCTVKLWDLQGRCLSTLIGHIHRIWDVAFSPNGKLLASAGGEGVIKLWDADTGRCLHTIEAHDKGVRTIAFNSESSILVSGSEDKSIKFWDIYTGECLRKIDAHDGSIRQLALSLDGQWIASCSEDQTIKFWHWETGELIQALPIQSSQVWSIAFIPDSNILISADQNGTIKFWDAITAKCFQILEENTRSSTQAIAVSLDGSMLAGGSNNQTIKLWQIDNGECLRTLHGYTNWILSASFSPDQRAIVTGSNDQTVRVWDVR